MSNLTDLVPPREYQKDNEDGTDEVVEQTAPDNPAAAALKLFFKLKGIEA